MRIAAVEQVVTIVVVDIQVIGVVPVVGPVFGIGVYEQERKASVLEARIPHIHNRARTKPEEVLAAEVEAEAVLRNVVSAVTATLGPRAMVGGPVSSAILLPVIVSLPAAFL